MNMVLVAWHASRSPGPRPIGSAVVRQHVTQVPGHPQPPVPPEADLLREHGIEPGDGGRPSA
jgi:hypothetical protein